MSNRKTEMTIGILLALAVESSGQEFLNLNFESASIAYTTNSSGKTGYSASAELPGWSVFAGGSPVTFFPNIGDSPSVALVYSNSAYVPSGNFAVRLSHNGEFGFGYPSGPGSISQAGLVPADAETLFFDVARAVGSGLSVSLSG
ncbi:MAG TPA: hypothetical protein VGR89_00630, partial [Puia sp.]|nr:hypothetical protein [Puia sp.]